MNKTMIPLSNSVFRDLLRDDKVYMDSVQITIADFPFATRQVIVRFADGPDLDLATADMDRIAIAYLVARGLKLPPRVLKLMKAEASPKGDVHLPSQLLPAFLNSRSRTQ